MITESNVQKTRYEMEDDPKAWQPVALKVSIRHSCAKGGKRIRAISKSSCLSFASKENCSTSAITR